MPNQLAKETSPYLLQHADNPVDWYPWGEEALALAREQDKPILLSIGYSACHWCHVMAHESFEDPATAAVMNEHFINIKVDREERPDLDQIYQSAHGLMNRRSGGWPLTMFLTPDQTPFYGGTYFPPAPRYNLPGFADLLVRVAGAYREQKPQILAQRSTLLDALDRRTFNAGMPDATAIRHGVARLQELFDTINGGLGHAPKFPNVPDWAFLVRVGDAGLNEMIRRTLTAMANGGIYDHLGGGFCRYSVDEGWEIPHFEKMLYDNGQLLCLYADGWQLLGEPRYRTVVEETVDWMQREMRDAGGAFYAALDADSEGEEGKYYVWRREELAALLSREEFEAIKQNYGLQETPNFEHQFWHLRASAEPDMPREVQQKLLQARELRVRPSRDDKILTSWNALAIKGLARSGRVFGKPQWIAVAQAATDFIRDNLWQDGILLATYKNGQARLNAYLDDHAFLLDALLELLQAEFRQQDLQFAIDIGDTLLARFEDEAGGFFFTSHDHETLIHRPKSPHDNAIPSGNGVAAFALQRLGHLLGEMRYLQAAEKAVQYFGGELAANPAACPSLLCAAQESLTPATLVILRGERSMLADWMRALSTHWLPGAMIVAIPADAKTGFPALDKKPGAAVNAWVCRGVECLPEIGELDALVAVL